MRFELARTSVPKGLAELLAAPVAAHHAQSEPHTSAPRSAEAMVRSQSDQVNV